MLRSRGLVPLVALGLLAAVPARATDETLRFVAGGHEVARFSKADLRSRCGERAVTVRDPYHGEAKRYRACPLAAVLTLGFGPLAAWHGDDVLLRALDGYTRVASGDQLATPGGFLAFEEADRPGGGFAPIDRRQVDPGPFYVVWAGPDQSDVNRWPWPYQLAVIECVDLAERFPHVVPQGAAPGSAPRRGFAIFRRECLSCHAINGEGGKVGPDLNVPRSIVEYRPEAQIKAFVRSPASFRYTSMPAHPGLSDADLDDLVAYLRFMSRHKHDPGGPTH